MAQAAATLLALFCMPAVTFPDSVRHGTTSHCAHIAIKPTKKKVPRLFR
jgi:hypothetical protein